MNISASKMKKKLRTASLKQNLLVLIKKESAIWTEILNYQVSWLFSLKNRVTSFLRSMKFKSETPFQSMSELSNFCIIKKHTFEISSKFLTNHNIYFGIWRICYCQIDYNKVIKESPIFTVHNFLSLTSFIMY